MEQIECPNCQHVFTPDQQDGEDSSDPLLKFSEVERMLEESRIFEKIPTRPTLITYCKDGTFESVQFRGKYLVYESSVVNFIRGLQRPRFKAA